MRRAICIVCLGLAVASAAALAGPLTILYTNDLHLRQDRLASLAALIEQERSQADHVLLLDAGDTWQDFRRPIDAVWGADEMVRWMNSVRYDAMAIGNHDLYWGRERLIELIDRADFPVLSANLNPVARCAAAFRSSSLHRIGDLNVLVIGVVTGEYLPYLDYPRLRYEAAGAALARELSLDREGPVDLVIALGHLPIADAVKIARRVPGIDVFITGHSHETTPEPRRVGNTLVVQSGAFARYLGRLRLNVEPGRGPQLIENTLLPTAEAPADVARGLRQLLRVVSALAVSLFLVLR